jgi:hypothetical protein
LPGFPKGMDGLKGTDRSFFDVRPVPPVRRTDSRVFVCKLLSIHFDAHAFLLTGNLFEGSNVVSGVLFAGNYDSSGQEVTLQSNGVLVVFPLRESCLVHAKQPGKLRLVQIDMLSQKTELFTAKPIRFLKNGNSRFPAICEQSKDGHDLSCPYISALFTALRAGLTCHTYGNFSSPNYFCCVAT